MAFSWDAGLDSETWERVGTAAQEARTSGVAEAKTGAEMRWGWAAAAFALSLARWWASVAAASEEGGPVEGVFAAESGERKFELLLSRTRDWRFWAKARAVGEDFNAGDLRRAKEASIWFCMEPTAGLRRAVMGSALAICWRTVMKKRIWTWVECWRRL